MTPLNLRHQLFRAPTTIADPGSAGTITIDRDGGVCSVVTAAAEARTLRRPTKAGINGTVVLHTDGGNLTLTVTGGYNSDGDTSITFGDAGDFVRFVSINVGGTYSWRVIAQEGTNIDALAVNAEATEHGAGAIGTGVAPATYRYSLNGTIITEIKVDLQGLASKDTADDVIGLSAGGNAYIGRNVVATNGVIFKIELICVETPAGGDNDVNVVVASSGTLAYDGACGTTYGVNGGDAAAGQVVQNLVQALTANHYFYLTAGTGDTAAAYTAGQFIVRLHGHAVLA